MPALSFIIDKLLELYVIAFVLRFLLQTTRADFHNPLSQFVVQITNPLVRPLRRIVPGWRGIDLSTLIIAYLLTVASGAVLVLLSPVRGLLNGPALLLGSLIALVNTFLVVFMLLIIGQVVLSWLAPYHPLAGVMRTLTAPILRPIQRIIPPIANIDLSPLFALLGLQALQILIERGL